MVPTFTPEPLDGVGVQLCPCNFATVTPQFFAVASRTGDINQPKSSPFDQRSFGCALLPSPDLPDLSWWPSLKRLSVTGSFRTPSVSLVEPGSSGSADPFRRCQSCFLPLPTFLDSGCSQLLPSRCDVPEAVAFHHRKVPKRLVALHVGLPEVVRPLRQQLEELCRLV